MLARPFPREHFFLGPYSLPHRNTEILLDWYCGTITETGLPVNSLYSEKYRLRFPIKSHRA